MPPTHARCPHPVTHRRAFSIWISDEESENSGFREDELARVVERAVSAGVHVASLTRMEPIDWTCPRTGRRSRTYVVELTSSNVAVGRGPRDGGAVPRAKSRRRERSAGRRAPVRDGVSVSNVDLDEWRAADKRAESNQLLVRMGYTRGLSE